MVIQRASRLCDQGYISGYILRAILTTSLYVKYALVNSFGLRCESGIATYYKDIFL